MAEYKPHYMRRYRLRAGLSQGEMAYLLGSQDPARVCRYEGLSREPDLRTVLAYQVLFGIPAEKLFPGIYQEVEDAVSKRAHQLSELQGTKEKPGAWHTREALPSVPAPKARAQALV